jgi:hypothetical protein
MHDRAYRLRHAPSDHIMTTRPAGDAFPGAAAVLAQQHGITLGLDIMVDSYRTLATWSDGVVVAAPGGACLASLDPTAVLDALRGPWP